MKYLVATFNIEAEADLLEASRDLLADGAAQAGFETFEETEQGMDAYVQKELFDREALDAYIADFPISDAHITYSIQDAEDKDWNQEWEEQGFEPIFVADQVVIYDAKHSELYPDTSNRPDIIEIGIEAKLAFGTGNHETTRMIISQLLQMPIKTKRVLDCGTGTGILGLTASKLGAKEVVGYDIDEWSVENAKHNALLNGVDNMEVLFGNSSVLNHISGVFDVVMANINRNILLDDMRLFRSVMNTDATLILSGFYEKDVPVLLEKANELGLHETARHTDNNWTCLVLKVRS
nr:50S ribosomal protein L11 methyltransferase [uncultured Prevotella sp.]